jgi:hypothetical protein
VYKLEILFATKEVKREAFGNLGIIFAILAIGLL